MTTQNRELASLVDNSGNVTATGNLTVSGTTTSVSSTNTTVTDPIIELNNGAGSNSNDLGFVFERGSTGDNACLIWDESNDVFAVGTTTATGSSTGNMSFSVAGLTAGVGTFSSLGIAGGSTDGVAISQGAIAIKNGGTQSYIDFYCESSNAHYARLQSAAHSAYSGNITATLPATTGTLALTSDIHTTEELQDIIGAMFSSNTESGITVAYQDSDGTIDLTVGTLNQNTTGSAATLTTARTIHGVSFDGSANIDLSEVVQDTVGAMFSSNTETGIAATYEDGDGTIDLVIGNDVIVNSMIADDAIDSAQIADGSIDTAHIANDQVTGDKLSNDVTIANDLTVAGNLVVTGSTTQTGSLLSNSNFQALSQNNSGNSTDFGFYGKYVESTTTKYAGLAFDASTDNTFRLFVDTQTAPSTTVNTGATGYAVGSLVANVTGNLTGNASGTAATVTGAAQSAITSLGTLTTLTVDDITINGSTISDGGDLTLDIAGNIILNADGAVWKFEDDSTELFQINSGSQNTNLRAMVQDKDIRLQGYDSSSLITALTLDMSEAGAATFNSSVIASTSARITQVALTSSSNATAWDASAAANAYYSTSENTTFSAPSNAVEGAIISVEIAQGGTARTVAWNTVFEFAASTAPTVTATANKTDIFTFRYNGSVWQEIGRVQNMAQT